MHCVIKLGVTGTSIEKERGLICLLFWFKDILLGNDGNYYTTASAININGLS